MTGRSAAKALVCALEAAALSTAFAPNLGVRSIAKSDEEMSAAGRIIGAIAALTVDMTMVAMTNTRMITTTLAAMMRATGRRLRRGGVAGGTIKVGIRDMMACLVVPC